MQTHKVCPECGAGLIHGQSCEANFHQMLFWENEEPQRGAVHHLMVLAYHIQHPSLYSREGLEHSIQLLMQFVEAGVSPQLVRQQNRARLSSSQRDWQIRGKPGAQAAYKHPVKWSMTTQDVIDAGADHYGESVQRWARTILSDLRSTQNGQE